MSVHLSVLLCGILQGLSHLVYSSLLAGYWSLLVLRLRLVGWNQSVRLIWVFCDILGCGWWLALHGVGGFWNWHGLIEFWLHFVLLDLEDLLVSQGLEVVRLLEPLIIL